MHTLQDFLLVTKAETYLIAIGFLVMFPIFWRWLNGTPRSRKNDRKESGEPKPASGMAEWGD